VRLDSGRCGAQQAWEVGFGHPCCLAAVRAGWHEALGRAAARAHRGRQRAGLWCVVDRLGA
jgi:hypothetical protein